MALLRRRWHCLSLDSAFFQSSFSLLSAPGQQQLHSTGLPATLTTSTPSSTPTALAGHPLTGALLETTVAAEIRKHTATLDASHACAASSPKCLIYKPFRLPIEAPFCLSQSSVDNFVDNCRIRPENLGFSMVLTHCLEKVHPNQSYINQ